MGETKQTQLQAKADFENKVRLACPSREILEELAVACATNPTPDNTFQYAFCLSKSDEKTELRYAVTILDGLVREGYEHQVDCMYGSATALYLLGDYEEARGRCEAILRTNPESRSASELHLASIAAQQEFDKKQVKKAATAGTIAIAAVGVVGILVSALLSKR